MANSISLSSFPTFAYKQISQGVSSTTKRIYTATATVFDALNKIKADPNVYMKALSLLGGVATVATQFTDLSRYDRLIKSFSNSVDVIDLSQLIDTADYFIRFKFLSEKRPNLDLYANTCFAFAGIGGAALWLHECKIIDLAKYSIEALGNISVVSAVQVLAIGGFIGLGINAYYEYREACAATVPNKGEVGPQEKQTYQLWRIATCGAEVISTAIALSACVNPLIGAGAIIAAKSIGLYSNLYKKYNIETN